MNFCYILMRATVVFSQLFVYSCECGIVKAANFYHISSRLNAVGVAVAAFTIYFPPVTTNADEVWLQVAGLFRVLRGSQAR